MFRLELSLLEVTLSGSSMLSRKRAIYNPETSSTGSTTSAKLDDLSSQSLAPGNTSTTQH